MTNQTILRPAVLIMWSIIIFSAWSAEGFELTDAEGVVHRMDRACSSIISLYPAHTENLVEMGAAGILTGIAASDTYPEGILHLPRYSLHDPVERFIAANPECLLVRPMISHRAPALLEKLRTFGIRVISLQPNSVQEMFRYWYDLGLLSGRESEARALTNRVEGEIRAYRDAISSIPPDARPKVYFEAIHARMRTFSPDSIAIFCLEAAGGINIAADAVARRGTNIADYGKERILARAQDIDVFLAQSGRMNQVTPAMLINEPGFGAIKAIREHRLHLVPETLVSRPTSRILQGIAEIRRLLYPKNLHAHNRQ